MGENISIGDSLIVTLFSIVMVFIVLIVISIFISMLKNINKSEKPINIKDNKDLNKSNIEKIPVAKVEMNKMDDEELVAVISAAIAASLDIKPQQINIKNIRRINNNSPAWASVGRQEQIHNNI